MQDELTSRVIAIIARTAHKPVESITAETQFAEAGIDSLDGMQILFALEEEFDISIPDEAARQIRGIPDAVNGVRQLIEAKANAAASGTA
jgi:acyl carrier protein